VEYEESAEVDNIGQKLIKLNASNYVYATSKTSADRVKIFNEFIRTQIFRACIGKQKSLAIQNAAKV